MKRDHDAFGRLAAVSNGMLLAMFGLLAALLWYCRVEAVQWHDPGRHCWLAAAGVLGSWMALAGWFRRRRGRIEGGETVPAASAPQTAAAPAPAAVDTVRVFYASQTGLAEQLARQTWQSLQTAGVPSRVDAIDASTLAALRDTSRALFVVSTTGDGEPPDMAVAFAHQAMANAADLASVRYGLLALGDSDYDEFCGFGRQLQRWLRASGAQALFDPVEVDDEDATALRHWQHHLAALCDVRDLPDWQPPRYQQWQLAERQLLNAGSLGGPCFHLALRPLQGAASWQAGDLVDIGPRHAPADVAQWLSAHALDGNAMVMFGKESLSLASLLARCRLPAPGEMAGLDETAVAARLQLLPHREYSIASVPADGAIHLLVRRQSTPDGTPGIGSGWLTMHAPIGSEIALRVRRNAAFHAPADARPLILIGNGTGMAALRALLKERIDAGRHRNWLLYGERQQAHDFPYRDEINRWLAQGQLERADFAWSREQAERIYVQHRLRQAADTLREWVVAGAAIQVCGSLQGMAPAVDAVLCEVLGDTAVEQLRETGRYRRDVY
ncbi:MAG TPA: sulfite reductase flavoprotein subunit alpha [Rhodanobacter sp.]|nr:sulfite reductase flavoprotein subunit alpha [Rhodanobacter sp.]